MRNLIGEYKPSRGTIVIDDKPLHKYSFRELAKKIAYIPQNHIPSFPYTVIDVVMMGRTSHIGYFASPGKADKQAAMRQLEFLQIDHLYDQPYTDISGGERQLVLIAAALNQEPELMILDEPTAHLDFGNQYRFIELIKSLQKTGMGVIMSTHFPNHALDLTGRTAILKDQKFIKIGPANEVVTKLNMENLYKIPISIENFGKREVCIPGELK